MATKLPKERESKIQRSIAVRLRRFGVVLFRRNVGVMKANERFIRFASPGQADLYGFHYPDGRHWEIETKRPGNRPTELQLAWLKECTRLGAVAFWSDSVSIAERIAEAVLQGGRIIWHDDDNYDIELP